MTDAGGGTAQTAEVYSGSGYYSQSSGTCFFGYPDENPPKELRVRWPSGEITGYRIPAGADLLTLPAH
jgi:hypothetical protein